MIRVVVLVAAALLGGCGPFSYVSTVTFQASKAVTQARRAGAEELAVYEYTMAAEYLVKARELAGYARWQEALRFGRAALDHGRRAESIAHEKSARPRDEKHE